MYRCLWLVQIPSSVIRSANPESRLWFLTLLAAMSGFPSASESESSVLVIFPLECVWCVRSELWGPWLGCASLWFWSLVFVDIFCARSNCFLAKNVFKSVMLFTSFLAAFSLFGVTCTGSVVVFCWFSFLLLSLMLYGLVTQIHDTCLSSYSWLFPGIPFCTFMSNFSWLEVFDVSFWIR